MLDDCNLTQFAEEKWRPLTLAHVVYPDNDIVGLLLAWFSLAPILVIVGSLSVLLFRREIQIVTLLFGFSVSQIINQSLKKMIGQPRPCSMHDLKHQEMGMPSNHAQFIFYFSTYLALFVAFRVSRTTSTSPSVPAENGRFSWNGWKCACCVTLAVVAVLVSYSRIYLLYHTWLQVACGACVGTVFGIIWFVFTVRSLVPWYPKIAALPVSKWLMVRDSSSIPNILSFEYKCARREAELRRTNETHKDQ